ncbi:ATPase, T2SS/T4P/T4SS family [Lentzea sp. NPDC006480]|uniref:CpaF family protein n=1 Tax=Lentzea sp. NPDC006480 TaxID=3157176 RepID=UPI0033B98093
MSLAPELQELRARLRNELTTQLSDRLRDDGRAQRPPLGAVQRRQFAGAILRDAIDNDARERLNNRRRLLTEEDEDRVIMAVLADVFGAAGLEPLLADSCIENIDINGADHVFVTHADGSRERLAPIVSSDDELIQLVRDLAARDGIEERRFDTSSPLANFTLSTGERVAATIAVTARPCVSIRRHRLQFVTLADLRANGTFDEPVEELLTALVRARRNILITGGVTTGKTTLLRALAAAIPPQERLITIEDVLELGLDHNRVRHPDVVALQARQPNIEGHGAVSMSELVWQSLRMQPDRVIVGEIRGPEVIPLFNAMSMGNDGSMSTLHASSSRGAFLKLAAYAVQGPERLTVEATNLLLASAVHFVVHLDKRRDGGRVLTSIREVVDVDGNQVVSNEIWRPGPDLRAIPGAPLRVESLERLSEAGYVHNGWPS